MVALGSVWFQDIVDRCLGTSFTPQLRGCSMSLARLVVTGVRIEGRTKAEVARDYRVSRQWVHELVRRYEADGGAGLEPRSRRPRRSPLRTPEALEDEIVELRKALLDQGLDAGRAHDRLPPRRAQRRLKGTETQFNYAETARYSWIVRPGHRRSTWSSGKSICRCARVPTARSRSSGPSSASRGSRPHDLQCRSAAVA